MRWFCLALLLPGMDYSILGVSTHQSVTAGEGQNAPVVSTWEIVVRDGSMVTAMAVMWSDVRTSWQGLGGR